MYWEGLRSKGRSYRLTSAAITGGVRWICARPRRRSPVILRSIDHGSGFVSHAAVVAAADSGAIAENVISSKHVVDRPSRELKSRGAIARYDIPGHHVAGSARQHPGLTVRHNNVVTHFVGAAVQFNADHISSGAIACEHMRPRALHPKPGFSVSLGDVFVEHGGMIDVGSIYDVAHSVSDRNIMCRDNWTL